MGKIDGILSKVEEYLKTLKFAEEEEQPVEEAPETPDHSTKTLGELIGDLSVDGAYTITVAVAGGKVVEAEVFPADAEEPVEEEVEMEEQKPEQEETPLQLAEEKPAQEIKLNEQLNGLAEEVEKLKVAMAEEKAAYELKLAELGKQAGENNITQAPVADKPVQKLSRKEVLKSQILSK